ncbi:MAG: hypothetical protein WA057_06410 [Candidatus Magasanikiibacteriota bacterium]
MKRDTIIEAGLNAVPYIGGSLATLYFGNKQEKRFERLEKFLEQVKQELEQNPINESALSKHNKEDLTNLIEDILNRVEIETREEKKRLLKNFFIKTLNTPIINDIDERKTFLKILDDLSEFECILLASLFSNQDPVPIRSLGGNDIYLIYGGVNKLISLGFLETRRGDFMMNGAQDENLNPIIFISDYGKRFAEYIKII